MKNTLILLILISINSFAAPQGTIFTYQGELVENNTPVTGSYDIYVSLFSESVNGTPIDNNSFLLVNIVDGVFSVDLDFGDTPFMGEERWIELEVRSVSELNYTKLSPRKLLSNAPYAIHSQFIGTNGVNTLAIQNGSITEQKIANNSVTTNKIVVGAVTEQKIANSSITSDKITTGAVTNSKVANNAIGTLNIIDQSISGVDIANNTITNTQLAADSISHTEIGTSAVRSDEILNGTIIAADVDSNAIQRRITGVCAANSSIRAIANDGTVTCEADDSSASGWNLTGNTGTTSGTDFIGTTDFKSIDLKVNNTQALQLIPFIESTVNGDVNLSNLIVGPYNGIVSQAQHSNSILAGTGNNISAGSSHAITNGNSNVINDGVMSTIVGGFNNDITGSYSVILGGAYNVNGGNYSFAAGEGANVRTSNESGDPDGDENTFVWSQTSFKSSGPDQVLFEANGGFGIGTNAPASPMHIKGEGKTFGVLADEVVLTVEPKGNTDDVSISVNRLDATKEAALAFTTNEAPDFDLRVVNGGALDFNSYQAGTAQFMMRINNSGTNRIDFNTNLEPQTDNVFDIGSSSFRFAAIHTTNINTTNPVNVTSDKRLKDNIDEIEYGLSEILNLKPVSYRLINAGNDKKHLGLIAQEVETIIPEIVNKANDEKHTRSMRYGELIPVLIKATQEQQVLIDQQGEQIKDLIKSNLSLLKRLDKK